MQFPFVNSVNLSFVQSLIYGPLSVKTEGNAASGQRVELATRLSLVRVPLWALAGFVSVIQSHVVGHTWGSQSF